MIQHSVLNFKSDYHSDYLNENILNLLDKTFIIPQDFSYNVFEVTKEYIARPDLISLDAYGDTLHTDVICKINGISNPFELNEGMKLILPAPENIMDFNGEDVREELFVDDVEAATVVKYKSDKNRKANEAIIGDSRFKVDPVAGIIIY